MRRAELGAAVKPCEDAHPLSAVLNGDGCPVPVHVRAGRGGEHGVGRMNVR